MQSNHISSKHDALMLLTRSTTSANKAPKDNRPDFKASAARPLCTVEVVTPDAPKQLQSLDPEQLLAKIVERYKDNTIVKHLLTPSGGNLIFADRDPSYLDAANDRLVQPAPIFNTGATSGSVNNVVGDYIVHGLDDKKMVLKMTLDKLAYAEGASWDPNLACLPGTRVSILSIINVWSRSLDGPNVFWLKGVAGSGKTAIAHTVAQTLREDGRLASSFFSTTAFPPETPLTRF
ncbi:hypothetical protein FIBSPDRAFT_954683 [Athelia psychrophila]|uniref:Nephrocystin 3-like N-terminal domain-containing protein n=1 Tax=Athelia psychrophila TaxID=1759441 RepID=A0A166IYU0_9AGAM|nr:hypothetical protein FIBSPDRAFT_954683 [Fibularhizoctonia sp. CBS 109695]